MSAGPLAGRRIAVTRPREQAAGLAALVREAGGEPLVFPALEILPPADPGKALAIMARLEEFDLAIFVSRNAARQGLELARRARGGKPWPAGLAVAAIGSGTRRELEGHGLGGVIAPGEEADSEALLALPQLAAPAGKSVLIVRGEGGRGFLGEALAARGARVTYVECYRRALPDGDLAPLAAALGAGEVDAVTASSAEGLANLLAMLGAEARAALLRLPLFVPHRRVAEAAARHGAREAIVAGPGDAQAVAGLVAYFGRKPRN
jgi:uroporphyrinogen-III synthase